MSESLVTIRHDVKQLTPHAAVLCLRCQGEYQVGSRGVAEARAIYAAANEKLRRTGASALLIDYTNLKYEWGDDMWLTLQIDHPDARRELPFAVVVGPECEAAIKSLLEIDGGLNDWLDSGFIFHNESTALEHLARVCGEGT